MPITAERCKELVARGEGVSIDFKKIGYDFAGNKGAANAELAKDIMAMANSLKAGAEPAYIFIGVQGDGSFVGVPQDSHPDDAALHQKVAGLLNRCPLFTYAPIEVDGQSIGVYEIRSGGRPYYALKDSPAFAKHVGYYRNGTSNEIASLGMALEWAREDDATGNRIRELELREREAEAKIDGSIEVMTQTRGGEGTSITLQIWNLGRRGFSISHCRWRVEWNERFFEELNKSIERRARTMEVVAWSFGGCPDGYIPPCGDFAIDAPGTVVPMRRMQRLINFRWTREEALRHFREHRIPIDGFNGDWATIHFEVPCLGELGTSDILMYSAR